jgi:hypothetical protein
MATVQTTSPLDVFAHSRLPRWARYQQRLDDASVGSIPEAMAREFGRPEIAGAINPGARVVLTAGSRGIDRIAEVLKAAVSEVRRLGGEPFVIPAMGSHGGATAEGQRALIEHYGVTEAFVGCPIRASMETVQLGTLEDRVPVWFDRIAHDEAGVVIPVGRVKPHTDFRGPVESGLAKMIAIGLGKQHGASWFHSQGIGTFGDLIPRVAAFSLTQINIPFGIALVENGLSKLAMIEAVPAAGMFEREAELLEIAKAKLARLPQVPAAGTASIIASLLSPFSTSAIPNGMLTWERLKAATRGIRSPNVPIPWLWNQLAPCCLPSPIAIILARPDSTCPRKSVCGLTRPTGITTSASSWAIRSNQTGTPSSSVPSWTVSIDARIGQPTNASVTP